MALKGIRMVLEDDITAACASVQERGVVVCYSTGGSGIALGDSKTVVDVFANPSGKVPYGLLMNDVVDTDTAVTWRNVHKDTTEINEPCTTLKKGRVFTNKVTGTPTAGAVAYLVASGLLSPTVDANGGIVATPKVGRFASSKDADGYAGIDINLPVV